jgi:hypothetical protein
MYHDIVYAPNPVARFCFDNESAIKALMAGAARAVAEVRIVPRIKVVQ